MKRSTKQLLSMLLAIVMVIGLAVPAMAARPMGGDAVETPAGEAAPQVGHSGSKASTAKLLETTGKATTYTLNFEDEELSGVASNGTYAAGKYGTGDFFTFSDSSIARKDVSSVPGLNLAKNGGNYIGFEITGTDATVKVTFRGASGSGKVSGGAVYKYDGDTQGDALVDANNPTDNIESNAVTVTATYTNVAQGSYRVVETANQTTVHVLSIEVTETDGNVYVDCTHTNAAADPETAVAATCTVAGKEADVVCPDCKKVITKGAVVAALGHDYNADGECTRCGDKKVTSFTGGEWLPTLANTPGSPAEAGDTLGTALATETLVDAKVTGVKFYVGAGQYKFKEETLMGNDNAVGPTKDAYATPTSGTYFKWVAEKDGVLTPNFKYSNCNNASKVYYIAKTNATGTEVLLTYNQENMSTGVTKEEPISVKAGDTIIGVGVGTKIALKGFKFSGGGVTEETAPWTEAGIFATPAMTATADNAKGTITVAVTGVKVGKVLDGATMTTYADNALVTMLDKDGKTVETAKSTTNGANHNVKFTPTSSGTYTFKVVAQREGETDLASAATASADFILPLKDPSISSAVSNGTGADGKVSMTLMWGAVPEGDSYKVYMKETSATDWPADALATLNAVNGKATYSYTATGLTAGTSYDFKVSVTRTATNETKESDSFTSMADAEKVTAWVEKTFGTSSTDQNNKVVRSDSNFSFTGLGKEVVTVANGTYTLTVPKDDAKMTATDKQFENLTGDLNTDPENRVLLSSWNGAGKIKEGEGGDGLLFYYTAIPAGTNYTLTADAEVLRWATRDTQNGFGLSAMDRVPAESWSGASGSNTGSYWNNVYYAGAARGSFSYDGKTGKTYSNADLGYDGATKYSYYMGPYAVTKTGIPMTANGAYSESAAPATYYERRFPLDTRLASDGRSVKFVGNTNRFNLIGNYVVEPKGYYATYDSSSSWIKSYELTKVKIQLQKNNTGYISTIWDETGKTMLGQNIEYFVTGAMDLSGNKPYHDDDVSGRKDIPALKQCLDSDYEYVGMFTSRDIDVLFSNVKLTTVDPAEDDPAVEPPYSSIKPNMSITSGESSNQAEFTLSITASVEGTVTVEQNGVALPDTYEIKYNEDGETERLDIPVTLKEGNNNFKVTFNPDPNQELPPYTKLENTNPVPATSVVTYNPNYKYLQNIYVAPAPKGSDTGYGTKSRPLDIYTAVKVVSPGQNIVLMEGIYKLQKGISIGRGMSGSDGTVTLQIAELDENGDPVVDEETGAIVTRDYVKDARIYMVADADENGDPVKVILNGQRQCSVLTQGASYWVFKDFEVVGSSGTGFQVAGNYNLVQNVKLHDNLSTGLQISRLSNGDRIPDRNGAAPSLGGDELITNWGDWPCHNIILNCESYRNYDSGYGGADGFGAKETCGEGNIFDGCAAYWNSDDGWDLYAKSEPDKGPLGRVTIKNSVAFENGYEVRKLVNGVATYDAEGNAEMNYDADNNIIKLIAGNGNGFKMGGSNLPGAHSISNSFAFFNKAKGFDSNSGPDIQVHNCTAYNNAEENVGLKSDFKTLGYVVDTTVSFKDDKCLINPDAEAGKSGPTMADATPTGGTSTYNYYKWDGKVSKGVGTVSGNITAANFVSLDFDNTKWVNGAVRDASGALDLGDFLKLTNDIGAGATQEKVEGEEAVETPENVTNPPQEGPSTNRPVGGSSGNGGTIADAIENAGKTDEDNTTETTFNANKTTDSAGNTEIVVKDETGETVADVKIPATIPDSDVVFEDAVGHWAEDAIEDMAALGIVNGIGDNTYGVDSDVTRGALATMLFRLANGKLGIGNTFDDVASGEWYTDAIGWAVKVGVVTGYPDDTFKPGDSITREQLATMLARFAKLVGLDVSADSSDLAGYKDVSDVDSWATDGMAWCVKNGVINGVSADSLSPDTSATRAQTATMLSRFIDLLK